MRYLFLFVVLINANIFAATELKFGFVNLEAVFSALHEAQKYVKDMEAQENLIVADEQKARIDIETKMANFKNAAAKLSDTARAAKEAEITAEIGALQQKFSERRAKITNDRAARVSEIENKILLLIESIGRKGGYSKIENKATILYLADELKKNDLTQELITQYNKAYPVKSTPATKPTAPAKPAPKKN